ncbi:MAG: hypothetical protein ACR2P1_16225 [Pseudomonadales bacterium]
MLNRHITALHVLLTVTPVCAEETWTDLSLYVFATAIDGEVDARNVTADVDVDLDAELEQILLEGFVGAYRMAL